jgi:protein gp37
MQETSLIPVQKTGQELIYEIKQIGAQGTYECGIRLREIKEKKLYENYASTFVDFCHQEGLDWKSPQLYRLISYVNIVDAVLPRGSKLSTSYPQEKILRPLKKLPSPEAQCEVWAEVGGNGKVTAEQVERAVEVWKINNVQPVTKKGKPTKLVFNWTTDKVDWAKWTWNPVFGCKHGCEYCYARDFANRQKKDFGKPELYMHKLSCPKNTVIPEDKMDLPGVHNVFVCSMSDLFGDWVPQDWIDKVFNAVNDNPQWNYIFLTKNPNRYREITFPENCWMGTTVDSQDRVDIAVDAFKNFDAEIKFVSFEPMLTEIDMKGGLEHFNWVIIGGQSKSSRTKENKQPWEWTESLLWQARQSDCKVYFKPNLSNYGPKEYPTNHRR